jgi:hypothetical protein
MVERQGFIHALSTGRVAPTIGEADGGQRVDKSVSDSLQDLLF